MTHVSAVLNQTDFRGREDSGNEATPTWIALANTNWTQDVDVDFRVRVVVAETAGATNPETVTPVIWYSYNGGAYAAVTGSTHVQFGTFTGATDDDATTQQLGAGSFVTGRLDSNASVTTADIQNSETEYEYCLTIDSAQVVNGNTIALRAYNAGVALDAYGNTPTVTVNEAANTEVLANTESLTLTTFAATVTTGIAGDFPVFETDFDAVDSGGLSVDNLTFDTPAGTAVDDLLVIVLGDDAADTDAIQWNTPTDFTREVHSGSISSDAHITVFTKPADGTELSTINVTRSDAQDCFGWYFRASGADGTPVVVALATTSTTGAFTHTVDGVETTFDNALVVAGASFDGGDSGTFTIESGVDWSLVDQLHSGITSSDASGVLAQRNQATSGAGVDVVFGADVADGWGSFQLAIAPAAGGDTDVSANVEELTLTTFQADVANDVDVQATTEALTLTTYQSIVTLDTDVQANVEALTRTTYPAGIGIDVDVLASVEELIVTTYQAVVSTSVGTEVLVNVEEITLTTFAADIAVDVDVLANVEALTRTTYQAVVANDVDVAAITEGLTLTTFAATIAVGGDVEVSANTEALTITTHQATIDVVSATKRLSGRSRGRWKRTFDEEPIIVDPTIAEVFNEPKQKKKDKPPKEISTAAVFARMDQLELELAVIAKNTKKRQKLIEKEIANRDEAASILLLFG